MSRVIKFRVFDTTTHDMYFPGEDGSQLVIGMTHALDEDKNYLALWSDLGEICKTGEAEFMQFTGLHDVDGAEIYEGDIWEWSNSRRRIVEFDTDRAGWFPFADNDGCGCCADEIYDPEGGKVIGNIYQHPNLLDRS